MSDTAVAAATPDPDPTGNVSTPPAHLPGESSMWFFVIGDLFIFAVYFVLYMVYRGQHHALFLQRSEEHTSELQSLMRISYAVFCLKKKKKKHTIENEQSISHKCNQHSNTTEMK